MKNASRFCRRQAPIGAALVVLLLGSLHAQSPTGTRPTGTSGSSGTPGAVRNISTADYRLGAGDKLRIEVYKDTQLSQSVQIRPDGKITLPLIGNVAAMGLTPIDLRERIATALKDYVNNPVVTVIVAELKSPPPVPEMVLLKIAQPVNIMVDEFEL